MTAENNQEAAGRAQAEKDFAAGTSPAAHALARKPDAYRRGYHTRKRELRTEAAGGLTMTDQNSPLDGSGTRHHRLTALALIREWADTPQEDRTDGTRDLLTVALTHAMLAMTAPDYQPVTQTVPEPEGPAADTEAMTRIAALLHEDPRLDDEDLIAAVYDIVGMAGHVTVAIPGDDDYAPEDARYESATGQLDQSVASAINTASSLYRVAVKSGGKPVPAAHARLIAEMMGDPAQYEGVYRAITTADTADDQLAQAARDAMAPFACFDCGTEVNTPGREPDHFDWCPRAGKGTSDKAGPEDGADYTIDKP